MGLAVLMAMAKPMFWAATPGSAWVATRVLMPMTLPLVSKGALPEVAGLTAALVWMRVNRMGPAEVAVCEVGGSWVVGARALATPALMLGPSGAGGTLPLAITQSAAARVLE